MHAPNSDALTPAAPRAPMHENAPLCTAPEQVPPPILTPSPNPLRLTPRQQTAISLLCSGVSLDLAAARLHINRSTLYRWRTTHPAFRAELARRQHDLHDTAARRMRLTLLHAIETVTSGIRTAHHRDDRVKTALSLLRHVDLPSLLAAPTDPTTPEHATDQLIRADWISRNVPQGATVTDADGELYLSTLDPNDPSNENTPPPPTHLRLRGGTPYPNPTNTPPPDPDFEI